MGFYKNMPTSDIFHVCVGNIWDLWVKTCRHPDMPEVSYDSYEYQGIYLGWDQNIPTSQNTDPLKSVNHVFRQ